MKTQFISDSKNSQQNTSVTAFFREQFPECKPFVRFGVSTDTGGQRQEPVLWSIHSPIPDDAITASPVYLLTEDQRARLERFEDNPYAVAGSKNVALELQDECETAGNVLYPVYAESDGVDDGVSFEKMVTWLEAFAWDVLEIAPDVYLLYFSGGRSIHLHAPLFVTHAQLGNLKTAAEEFCEETGADLDTCIYGRKRQFRLPGVVHKSGIPKVRLDPEDPNGSVARRVKRGDVDRPETFADALGAVFDPYLRREDEPFVQVSAPDEPDTERVSSIPHPRTVEEQTKWDAYNRHEFSPYANSKYGGQSVVAFDVFGEPFEKTATYGQYIHIPAYIYAGHGCTGTDYTKHREYAPIQLSTQDAEKWAFEQGECVVLIGGQSRSSRIFRITEEEAAVLSEEYLHYEEGDRRKAVHYLEQQGYDVGKGKVRDTPKPQSGREDRNRGDRPLSKKSSAARLERKAERDGIHILSYRELRRVAFRRLKRDWDYAWEWFCEQFGEDFDPDLTWRQFSDCVQSFPEDYTHVNVPPQP